MSHHPKVAKKETYTAVKQGGKTGLQGVGSWVKSHILAHPLNRRLMTFA